MILTVRQKEILTGITGLALFFGGFLVSELSFRAIQIVRFGDIQTISVIDTPEDNQATLPDATGKSGSKHSTFYEDKDNNLRLPHHSQKLGLVRINNHGFRGPDIPSGKPAGIFRVAFLGSSTTYDANVAEGRNWPEMTVKLLQEHIKDCQLDFINSGLPGFSTNHMQKYWESAVRNYAVDLVIILPGDMTADIQKAAISSGHNTGQHKKKSWFASHSLLWEKIEKNASVIRAQRSAFNQEGKFTPDIADLSLRFSNRLKSLIDAVTGDGTYVAVATISSHVRRDMDREDQLLAADSALFYMPYLSIPTLLDTQDIYNNVIRDVLSRSSAQLIEVGDLIPADNVHFADSRHYSAPGSAAMARIVTSALQQSSEFVRYIQANSTGCRLSYQNSEN